MGVHIKLIKPPSDEADPRFNWIRMNGDKDFIWSDDIEFEFHPDAEEFPDARRPKDLSLAIEWVRKNTPVGNQKRLVDLLVLLQSDPSLWLDVSF